MGLISETSNQSLESLSATRFNFLSEDHQLIQRFNTKMFDPELIKQHIAICHKNNLEEKQRAFLKIVLLSREDKSIQIAASNAIMILQGTFFSFYGLDLQGISIPHASFSRTVFDRVNFKNANLEDVEFNECSLNHAILDGANLKDVKFSNKYYLRHVESVEQAAYAPKKNILASVDYHSIYLWDLTTLQMLTRANLENFSEFDRFNLLLFSRDEELVFIAKTSGWRGKSILEVWHVQSLRLLFRDCSTESGKYTFFYETPYKTLITAKVNDRDRSGTELCLWKIQQKVEIGVRLEKIKTEIFKEMLESICVSDILSLIATFNHDQSSIEFYELKDLKKIDDLNVPIERYKFETMTFCQEGNPLLIRSKSHLFSITIEKTDSFFRLKKSDISQLDDEKNCICEMSVIPNSPFLLCQINCNETNPSAVSVRNISSNFDEIVRINYASSWHGNQPVFSDGKRLFRLNDKRIELTSLDKCYVADRIPRGRAIDQIQFSSNEEMLFLLVGEEFYKYAVGSGSLIETKTLDKTPFPPKFENSSIEESCFMSLVDKPKLYHSTFENFFYHCSFDQQYLLKIQMGKVELWKITTNEKLGWGRLTLDGPDVCDIVCSNDLFPMTYISSVRWKDSEAWEINWEKKSIKNFRDFKLGVINQFTQKGLITLQRDGQLFNLDFSSQKMDQIPIKAKIESFQVSEDGRLLVFSSQRHRIDSSLILYDLQQHSEWDHYSVPYLDKYKISPQGKFVVGWGMDMPNATHWEEGMEIFLWKIDKGRLKLLWKIPPRMELANISFKKAENLDQENQQRLEEGM